MKRLTLLLCVVFAAGMMILPAEDKRPSIAFDSLTKDLGKVSQGEAVKHIFKFTNKGEATLEILKVEPS